MYYSIYYSIINIVIYYKRSAAEFFCNLYLIRPTFNLDAPAARDRPINLG